jgi:hypothetical protein
MFWNVGWPLLKAEGFFCNLDILYGGLGIGVYQKKKFSWAVIFFNFWSLKPWIRIRSGSGLVSSLKRWIRIRKKLIRIRNPALNFLIHLDATTSMNNSTAAIFSYVNECCFLCRLYQGLEWIASNIKSRWFLLVKEVTIVWWSPFCPPPIPPEHTL